MTSNQVTMENSFDLTNDKRKTGSCKCNCHGQKCWPAKISRFFTFNKTITFLLGLCLVLSLSSLAECSTGIHHQTFNQTTPLSVARLLAKQFCGPRFTVRRRSNIRCLRNLLTRVRIIEQGNSKRKADPRILEFLRVARSKHIGFWLKRLKKVRIQPNFEPQPIQNHTNCSGTIQYLRQRRSTSNSLPPNYGTHRKRYLLNNFYGMYLAITPSKAKGVLEQKPPLTDYRHYCKLIKWLEIDQRPTGDDNQRHTFAFYGKAAKRYICINKRGKVFVKRQFQKRLCNFEETISEDKMSIYTFAGSRRKSQKPWYLAINRDGTIRKRSPRNKKEKSGFPSSTEWMPIPSPTNNRWLFYIVTSSLHELQTCVTSSRRTTISWEIPAAAAFCHFFGRFWKLQGTNFSIITSGDFLWRHQALNSRSEQQVCNQCLFRLFICSVFLWRHEPTRNRSIRTTHFQWTLKN